MSGAIRILLECILVSGIFLFLQRAIHLIYKERRWYHFPVHALRLVFRPLPLGVVFELTDDIKSVHLPRAETRGEVQWFIDVIAVFMSLCSMVIYLYCYIYLVAYFILRLLCVAFYWPHAWCRCAVLHITL